MAEAPEFPQESPAIRYIVQQVAMMHDTAACTTGYYKAQKDMMRRMAKVDEEINRLRSQVEALTTILAELDPDQTSQYFRDALDRAVSEIGEEAKRQAKDRLDRQISLTIDAARRMENTCDRTTKQAATLNKEIGEACNYLVEYVADSSKRIKQTSMETLQQINELGVRQKEQQDELSTLLGQSGETNRLSNNALFAMLSITAIAGIALGVLVL